MKNFRKALLTVAVAVASITSCDNTEQNDYVSILITRESQVIDVVSIDLNDSRVARAVFASDEHVIEINALTRQITDADLAYICRALDATDVECFS